MSKSIMFVAGDPSGDEHASAVVRQLALSEPGTETYGIGGPAMAAEGFAPLLPFEPFNRMGFAEVVRHLPFFLHAKSHLITVMQKRMPSVLVCVDYPGFNIPLMKAARELKIPVVWYIAPQVWAWKKKRAAVLGAHCAHIAVVFPFETQYFTPYKAPVSFVGHPLVERVAAISETAGTAQVRTKPSAAGPIRLALVPGSRQQEILRMLRPMAEAALILKKKLPGLRVTVSRCSGLDPVLFSKCCAPLSAAFPNDIEITDVSLASVLASSDLAIVTSGTATLQTALAGVPMVIAYRTSNLTYSLLKNMITLPYIGLPNIVAGEMLVPECIQHAATPLALSNVVLDYIESPDRYATTVGKLSGLRALLGEKKPSVEVARIILDAAYNRSSV
jgi:lipid-A-disaccharide synthase